jgi:arylsulfatase A-like enzyme
MPYRRLLPLPLIATLVLVGCHKSEPPRPRNIILILVDTLRADHLGIYGYPRPTSPHVDALARESVLFRNARSQASCTFPSANSILTSRYPSAFLGQADDALGIPDSIPSIAEILQGQGWRTVAVSASPVVRKSPGRFNPSGGYGRGFEDFEESCTWKPANCVNRAAFRELDAKAGDTRPLFLYLHYLDPHGPYHPPQGHPRTWATGRPEKKFIRDGNPNPIGDHLYKGAPDPGITPADLRYLVDLYDEEIAYFDGQLGRMLDELRRRGLLDTSVLIFVSDHGEEFLEHGHIKHCRTVFDSSIHTPMMVRIPGVAPRSVDAPVQNLDVVPTLLDLLGIDPAKLPFEGRSLRPLVGGGRLPATPAWQFGMQGTLRSAADGRYKLIHDLAAGTFALYDLRADPGETRDTIRRDRRAFYGLRESLTAWLARTEGKGKAAESLEADRKLRSLGYIE